MAPNPVRLILALTVAPIIASIASSIALTLVTFVVTRPTLEATNAPMVIGGVILFFSAVGVVIAVPLTATLGLAWHMLMQGLRWTSAIAYIAPAAVAGLALSVVAVATNWNNLGVGGNNEMALLFWAGAIGAVTGYVFWVIRRPDRDAVAP